MEIREKRMPLALYCVLTAALLLLFCTKSSPLYPLNDWVDVNIYCTIGKGMFRGLVPYRDLYDQKGPVVYFVYGLAMLLTDRSYLGVFLLEVASVAGFLYCSAKTAALFTKRDVRWLLPPLCLALVTSLSFSHGGSLEEITLPIFAYGLYSAVKYYKETYPARPALSTVAVNGLLAGLLLFAKFSMLGFHFAWMAVLAVSLFVKKDWRYGLLCCGVFLLAMLLPGVPWLVYFGAKGALPDFFYHYFYRNIFGYSVIEPPVLPNMLRIVVRHTAVAFFRNLPYTGFVILGFLACTFSKRRFHKPVEKINLWALGLFCAFSCFMGGQGYRYYVIPMAAFAALGLAPLMDFLAERVWPRFAGKGLPLSAERALPVALVVLCAGLGLLLTGNRYLMLTPRAETPQYRFAARMREESDGDRSLLCRAFPDSGFYMAADVLPDCLYFTSTNVPMAEYSATQSAYMAAARSEFAITRDRTDAPGARYILVDEASLPYEGETRTFRLYRRTETEQTEDTP